MGEHWPVIGHEWAVARLSKSLANGRLRHAYLFTGPESIGKTTLALALAQAVNCTSREPPCGACRSCRLIGRGGHPDVRRIAARGKGGRIRIEQVRGLQRELALKPYEGRYRVAIIEGFHKATGNSADALLKTLEEPPAHAVLILTALSAELLLPTIVSRCQVLSLRPLPVGTVRDALRARGVDEEMADLVARLSGGRIGWALRIASQEGALERRSELVAEWFEIVGAGPVGRFAKAEALIRSVPKDELSGLLDFWESIWRDVLLAATGGLDRMANVDVGDKVAALAEKIGMDGAYRALDATRRARAQLDLNANPRLTLEVMLLSWPRAGDHHQVL